MRPIAVVRLMCVVGLMAVVVGLGASAEASAGTVPFADPDSDGYIGFCDLAGNNVTSGSVDSAPFVWKAVSSVVPPKSYTGKGENAALYIYQARQGVLPGDWSGDGLTSAGHYTNSREPTAVATYKDFSLKVITTEFPPLWDGLYQLRMQFGKINYGVYSATYPTTVIQVTGNTWRVVSGGLVDCAKAAGVSQETVAAGIPQQPRRPVKGETAPSAAAKARSTPPTASSTKTTPTAKPSAGGLVRSATEPISAQVSLPGSSGGISRGLIVLVVVAAIVLAGLLGTAFGRRRGASG